MAREEELEIIQSIYCDAYNTFEAVDDTHFIFRSFPVVLSLILPLSYPDPYHLPEISLDSEGLGISKLQMFQLQLRLDAILQSKPDEPVLFELTEETREFTEGLRDDIKMCLDEEEEEVRERIFILIVMLQTSVRITDENIVRSHMGSTTLEGIMNRLPPTTKLLHAEIVVRTDLRSKFMDMRRKIQENATRHISNRRRKDALWDKYGDQEIVFHGTPRCNVGSIVKSGFIVPGQKTADGEKVGVRCGSTWGMGIYTSPDQTIVLGESVASATRNLYFELRSYTDYTEGGAKGRRRLLSGQKLIVCAVIMGRRCYVTHNRRLNPAVEEGYDSHVSPSELEYIVFNSHQILPLYVLHLGDSEKHQQSENTTLALNSISFKGNLTEYARKHLPNGFGAASGHRFQVLEIAPVDDDEELWGEYQHDDEKGEFQDNRGGAYYQNQ